MLIERAKSDLTTIDGLKKGLLAVTAFSNERPPQGLAGLLDWRIPGKISTWLQMGFFRASFGEKLLFTPGRRLFCHKILLFGGGEYRSFTRNRLEVARSLASAIAALKETHVFIACDGATPSVAEALRGSTVEQILLLDLEPGRKLSTE